MSKRKQTMRPRKPYEEMTQTELALEQLRLLDDVSRRLGGLIEKLDAVRPARRKGAKR